MRTIKFRWWDGKRFETMNEIIADIQCGKDWKDFHGLEQFTGLLDKNGKEIYEGDVLKTDELNWIGACVYHYDGFMLAAPNGGFSSPSWKNCEVIGNVHSNPDPLTR